MVNLPNKKIRPVVLFIPQRRFRLRKLFGHTFPTIKFGRMNVSTHSRRPEQSGEVLAHVVGFAGRTRPMDVLEVVTDKHTMQIDSLASQIEVKNDEISKFNEDLKDLRRQNNDLKITMDSKD